MNNKIKLMESSFCGFFRIWDYESGNLLQRIKVSNDTLGKFDYFDEDNIIICSDCDFILLNLNKKECSIFYCGYKKKVSIQSIGKINDKKLEFISQNLYGKIIIYIIISLD